MAPAILRTIQSAISDSLVARDESNLGSAAGPLVEARQLLKARSDDYKGPDPASGGFDPHDINNVGFFILFALIGVAFVATGIWFFFWAKNGGFHFKEDDWSEYKSTVMRRKGPNGTLLSGATPTTDLGGGSVYKDVSEGDHHTVVTESTAFTGITAGPSEPDKREQRRRQKERRDRERRKERRSRRHVGEEGVQDEMAETDARNDLRTYRHERPARVGGLNKESDGSNWDGSTNPAQSETSATATTELLSSSERTPTGTPTKASKGGIRKVYSTADRNSERETERLRAEAKRLREEGRTVRRDFAEQRAGGSAVGAESDLSESLLESGTGSDMGTKSYYHPMPELREQRKAEREERRARRGGYRRGRTEDDQDL